MESTNKLVEILKNNNQDLEFYPTTDEIIKCIRAHHGMSSRYPSILDCGAGNGVTLLKLADKYNNQETTPDYYSNLYVIEKSEPLRGLLNKFILIGTDFNECDLWNKNINVTFSNPPYSCFEMWAEKIILQSQSEHIYLVLPKRWSESKVIARALERRKTKAEVLGSFDFNDAERKARASVDVVYVSTYRAVKDYFDLEFADKFDIKYDNYETRKAKTEQENLEREQFINKGLVDGGDYVNIIYNLYLDEKAKLFNLFNEMQKINPELLEALSVDFSKIKNFVLKKLEQIDYRYWNEVITKLNAVSKRLITKEREALWDRIKTSHLDFTPSNIYHVAKTCINIVNDNIDNQVLSVYNQMIDSANVVEYKSNKRVFIDNNNKPITPSKLGYRIISSHIGSIIKNCWDRSSRGLSERGVAFVNDLMIIAENLGYNFNELSKPDFKFIDSGEKVVINAYYNNQMIELLQFRAYFNGNMHFKFNQRFMDKLNVIKGRLEGWLHSVDDVANEFDTDTNGATAMWNMSNKVSINPLQIEFK